MDRCRRVTVTPRVVSSDPSRARAIQALLDAATIEVRGDDCWLTFLDYAVHHGTHGVLDVSFRFSGAGAYPSTRTSHVVLDLSTGSRLRAEHVFSRSALPALTAEIRRRVASAWTAAKKNHPEVFRGRKSPDFGPEHLENFVVSSSGVTFFYEFPLPHAVESAMPVSEYPLTEPEIRRFVDPKGPLGFLIGSDQN